MNSELEGRLRELVGSGPRAVDLYDVHEVWAWLGEVTGQDVVLGRLCEGHVDGRRILREALREPHPGVYGVWASASGGTGLVAEPAEDGWRLHGTMRFCSGAGAIDRALVVASSDGDMLLFDLDAHDPSLQIDWDSWPAVGMARSESYTIRTEGTFAPVETQIGEPGYYIGRRGFPIGGIGVAATWLGAASGLRDGVLRLCSRSGVDPFARAELGHIEIALRSAAALLRETRTNLPLEYDELTATALMIRGAAERTVTEVLERAGRVVGPAGLCLDAALAQQIADLGVYIRQHPGNRDIAALSRVVHTEIRDK